MNIVILNDANAVATIGAKYVAESLTDSLPFVLGLATGDTPLNLYKRLIDLCKTGKLSFERVSSFNLDEYIGLSEGDSRSYRFYMDNNFFNHIDILSANTHVPTCLDSAQALDVANKYENEIKRLGGVDLQILGIGCNGHIGFNEPTSSFNSRTRMVKLAEQTMQINQQYFDEKESQPAFAITVGVKTILEAKKIMLIATGEHKAEAVASTIEGPLAAFCPASALQLHPDATILLDLKAASKLKGIKDYVRIENENLTDFSFKSGSLVNSSVSILP